MVENLLSRLPQRREFFPTVITSAVSENLLSHLFLQRNPFPAQSQTPVNIAEILKQSFIWTGELGTPHNTFLAKSGTNNSVCLCI
jgi:hypothetical protein